jgi:thermitase
MWIFIEDLKRGPAGGSSVYQRFKRLLSILFLILFAATNANSQYLIRHGQRIPLKKSSRYLALRLNPGVSPDLAIFTSAIEAGAPKEVISKIPLLESKGIVLIATAVQPEAKGTLPHFTSAANDLGTVLPVYELGTTDMVLTDEVLFKLESPKDESAMQRIAAFGEISNSVNGGFKLRVPAGKSALDVANVISEQNKVQYSEPNFVLVVKPRPRIPAKPPKPKPAAPRAGFPSDVFFPQQWSFENRGENGQVAGADIRVHPAWKSADGAQTIVAIIDDGVDITHPDLNPPREAKIVKPYDAVTGGKDPSPLHWWDRHGTSCAGVAAAVTNNIQGMAGVGYKAPIMPIKVASTPSNGGSWITSPEILASGINWAVDNGADVINLSWTMSENGIVESAIRDGLAKGRHGRGAVFVMAAGNEGTAVDWPAKLAETLPVIAVSAINEWNELKTADSRDKDPGWASNFGKEITVAAPGVHIFATNVAGGQDEAKDLYYSGFNGTSSSAPHVAGVVALILSKEPGLTADQVKKRLQDSADPIGNPLSFGAGRVNACQAVHGSGCTSAAGPSSNTAKP